MIDKYKDDIKLGTMVREAIERVKNHGGEVEYLSVDADGIVRTLDSAMFSDIITKARKFDRLVEARKQLTKKTIMHMGNFKDCQISNFEAFGDGFCAAGYFAKTSYGKFFTLAANLTREETP